MQQLPAQLLIKQTYLAPLIAAGVVLFVLLGTGILIFLAPRIRCRGERCEAEPEKGRKAESKEALPAAKEREALPSAERAALPPPQEK